MKQLLQQLLAWLYGCAFMPPPDLHCKATSESMQPMLVNFVCLVLGSIICNVLLLSLKGGLCSCGHKHGVKLFPELKEHVDTGELNSRKSHVTSTAKLLGWTLLTVLPQEPPRQCSFMVALYITPQGSTGVCPPKRHQSVHLQSLHYFSTRVQWHHFQHHMPCSFELCVHCRSGMTHLRKQSWRRSVLHP